MASLVKSQPGHDPSVNSGLISIRCRLHLEIHLLAHSQVGSRCLTCFKPTICTAWTWSDIGAYLSKSSDVKTPSSCVHVCRRPRGIPKKEQSPRRWNGLWNSSTCRMTLIFCVTIKMISHWIWELSDFTLEFE